VTDFPLAVVSIGKGLSSPQSDNRSGGEELVSA
jgi:hypothetical protein